MNPWALDKDISIKALLVILNETLGAESFELDQSSSVHAQSIRLLNVHQQEVAAYIYTYGQQPNHYGIDLEYPDHISNRSMTIESLENVGLQKILELLRIHLDIPDQDSRM